MNQDQQFDVIIIGGSYSGLSAAMALGRALKRVLVIDSGKACNRQTPYSHNFLTQDGKSPKEISTVGKEQVQKYGTVVFLESLATTGRRIDNGFEIEVTTGETFSSKKLVFATGIKDILPPIKGVEACWGITVIHCPYCHGYEVKNEKTGILGNGDSAYDFCRLISNWTKDLTLYTNGTSTLTTDQLTSLKKQNIEVVEKEIEELVHTDGHIENLTFKDGSTAIMKALYAPSPFEQHCKIPELLGCVITDEGFIKIDPFQETTIEGIYACGDNTTRMRTVSNAVAMGTTAGIAASKKMILEEF